MSTTGRRKARAAREEPRDSAAAHGAAVAFARSLPFPLDPFQRQAIDALIDGFSVLVTAPTGAGKTVVADFAAFQAMATGRKLAYTTPIKALSNQKYRQLVAQYGPEHVGIVTGDTVINRSAPLLVMTTEILRNLLVVSRDPLDEIGYVVVDEIHFLADEQRGVVWEEMLIWCPRHVQLVCLSATVSNAREVADWLSGVHGPTRLVRHDERPVPLDDYLYYDGELQLVRDAAGRRVTYFPHVGIPEDERSARRAREGLQRDEPREPDAPTAPALVARLRARAWLPAIYFRFGRAAAEDIAWSIVDSGTLPFLSEPHARAIEDATVRAVQDMDDDTRGLEQVADVVRILPSGIAYHHAGLIHPLKQLVEELFAAGHLDVVVATSTLAMGLHLPARAVVIGELKKFNGRSFEPLTATEYRQMTGRAGRRGIDTRGVAVLVPSPYLPFEPAFRTMSGEPEPLRSAFELRYNTLLNTYRPDDEERILVLLENNLAEYHRRREAQERGRRRDRRRGLRTRLYVMLDVLVAERLMDRDGELKTKGQVARHIFNSWEIVVTQILLDGSLAALEPAEVVEAISLFIPSRFTAPEEEPRRGVYVRRLRGPRRPPTPLEEIAATIETLTTRLRGREGRQGIDLTPEWSKPDHRFVRAWCEHGRLSETVEEFAVPAGDALQLLGQTLDLLEQCVRALSEVFGADHAHVTVIRRALAAISQGGKLERLLGL